MKNVCLSNYFNLLFHIVFRKSSFLKEIPRKFAIFLKFEHVLKFPLLLSLSFFEFAVLRATDFIICMPHNKVQY